MCCHPFFKTRIPIPTVEKGERGKNVKTFWIGNNTTGSILNMKAECSRCNECDSVKYLHFHRLRLLSFSWFWPPLPVHQTNHKYSSYRLSSSLDHHHRLLKWQKNLLLPMNSKLLNVYYSFIIASINYVYLYLTLSTSACLWNQLFMETQFKKKKSLYYMYLVLTADFIKKNYHSVYLIQVQYIIMYTAQQLN